MEKSKIEWCDYTYNPVTGCLHNCPYCYAEKMSRRFCGDIRHNKAIADFSEHNGIYEIENEIVSRNGRSVTYPFGFAPTLHKNRLTKNCKPAKVKKPSTFFVCSTADLFGEWVPDEWIEQVFKVCLENPRHRYLFLTKNPARYRSLSNKRLEMISKSSELLYGATATTQSDVDSIKETAYSDVDFLSIEPLLGPIDLSDYHYLSWVIVGAETGQRRGKVIPKKEWISKIVDDCYSRDVPVFLKNNLADIWKDELIQQYPWSV